MKSFFRCSRFVLRILFCLLAAAVPAAAGTLSGVVRNGTTGSAVSGQDVILIEFQGGMQPVETVKTDAQGRYAFTRPELGPGPLLVRAPYRGVNYHQNVPPGVATADIEVFEPTAPASSISVVNHAIIFQPNGATLIVGEEFSVHNLSKPPATYFSNDGTFEFVIPAGATLGQVSASGPAGMPLAQGAIDKAKNRYAVAFALKPGENTLRISYQLPYTGNQASIRAVSPLAAQRVVIAGPAGVQISSDGFAPAGSEQGYTFYSRDAVGANIALAVTVSGSAMLPSAGGGGDARDSSGSGPSAEAGNIAAFPPRLAGVQWILIAGFAALFVLGVIYLWRQPRAATVTAGSAGPQAALGLETVESASQRKRKRDRAESRAAGQDENSAPTSPAPSPAPPLAPSVTVASIDRDVRMSLDELKDTLFRLELRRQAGTISEDDYARERSRLEGVLRSLVRG